MVKRNLHVAKLNAGYLFPEIIRRKQAFLQKNPNVSLISFGIGDTTEPLPSFITNQLQEYSQGLGTYQGYTGYGPEEGYYFLRESIAKNIYQNRLNADEIFISDGTNCDIGRLQVLFGGQVSIAVQDPSYPVYVDTGVILGQSLHYQTSTKKYEGITYMPCHPENDFFPTFQNLPGLDLIYFCSPNNPTGAVATRDQLTDLVNFAKKNRSIIIFDAAYSSYIQDKDLPRSIYEIDGAKEVAIELGSFSKMAGFTGVRLGWSVVPKELKFEDGHSVHHDWNRVHSTFFNGASNISQAGGKAILEPEGQKNVFQLIQFYMENASILRKVTTELNFETYGGINAPYIWVKIPKMTSWEAFDLLLEKGHLLSAPGSGFGPLGEGFLRLSAFGKRADIITGAERLRACLSRIT